MTIRVAFGCPLLEFFVGSKCMASVMDRLITHDGRPMARPVPRCACPRGSLPNASQRPAPRCAREGAAAGGRGGAQKLFDWTEFERHGDRPLGKGRSRAPSPVWCRGDIVVQASSLLRGCGDVDHDGESLFSPGGALDRSPRRMSWGGEKPPHPNPLPRRTGGEGITRAPHVSPRLAPWAKLLRPSGANTGAMPVLRKLPLERRL